jgi:hypothetical protein
MYTDNKQVRNVAEAAYKIMMGEKLHPNQQVLDVHEPEKDELTADDFKKLRAKKEVKKEEVEEVEESKGMPLHRRRGNALNSDADRLAKRDKPNDFGNNPILPQGKNLLKVRMKADQGKHTRPNLPEEVEQIDEISKSTLGSYVKKASLNRSQLSYGSGLAASRGVTDTKGIEKDSQRAKGISKAVGRLTGEEVEQVQESTPPGFEGTVKAMKKHKEVTNPFALAWSMKNKGYKSHKKADGSDK